jgi:transposase-like protein
LAEGPCRCWGKLGFRWYVDERYIKVRGRWCYLYRALHRSGALIDVMFSERRDMATAKSFFRSATLRRLAHDQRALALDAPGVTGQGTVVASHTIARNRDCKIVCGTRADYVATFCLGCEESTTER